MLTFPEFDPVAFKIGPLAVHWYGIMYLIGFAGGWWLGLARISHQQSTTAADASDLTGRSPSSRLDVVSTTPAPSSSPSTPSDRRLDALATIAGEKRGLARAMRPNSGWTPQQVTDALFYVALGVVLGGRIGYTLFYGWDALLEDPLTLFRIWEGGMSFHGGFLGVMLAMWLFNRKYHKHFFDLMDYVAPLVTIGLGAGRLGNFINGELWGRVSHVPWAMVFPQAGPEPRHPSQLYEFFLEGVLLFIILWTFSAKPRPRMAVSGLFALCYGVFRFVVEFYRQPDWFMGDNGFIAFGWLTMGQLLCVPMILVGAGLLWWAYRENTPAAEPELGGQQNQTNC